MVSGTCGRVRMVGLVGLMMFDLSVRRLRRPIADRLIPGAQGLLRSG